MPIAPKRELRLAAWLLALSRRWARPPRADALDFQDTQPSIRDTGPTHR